MKLRLSEECGIYTKFYVLHFFVWADLWPYCNAYVRQVTRAKPKRRKLGKFCFCFHWGSNTHQNMTDSPIDSPLLDMEGMIGFCGE